MLSYCHRCITSANMKGLKAAPINRPTRRKKKGETSMPYSIFAMLLCTILQQYRFLLAFQKGTDPPQRLLKKKTTRQHPVNKTACKAAFFSHKHNYNYKSFNQFYLV